jgi:hypothetical protein
MKMDSSSLYSLLLERRPTFVRQLRLNKTSWSFPIVHRNPKHEYQDYDGDDLCSKRDPEGCVHVSFVQRARIESSEGM